MSDIHSFNHTLIRTRTWGGAKEQLLRLASGRNWIFRGHARFDWNLQTSLERKTVQNRALARVVETQMIAEFKRKASNYPMQHREPQTLVEWLSLMQHYGAPTRLLDWTQSPYVAAFFCLEDVGSERLDQCAIWALDSQWLQQQYLTRIAPHLSSLLQKDQSVQVDSDEVLELVMNKGVALAIPLAPYKMNERFLIQQGMFVMHGDISRPFEENLLVYDQNELRNRFIKVLIPANQKANMLRDLTLMNITSATLFPGLEGFAKSFAHFPYLTYKELYGEYADKHLSISVVN